MGRRAKLHRTRQPNKDKETARPSTSDHRCSRTVTTDSHLAWITAKRCDGVVHALKGVDDVLETEIGIIRGGSLGWGKEAKHAESTSKSIPLYNLS